MESSSAYLMAPPKNDLQKKVDTALMKLRSVSQNAQVKDWRNRTDGSMVKLANDPIILVGADGDPYVSFSTGVYGNPPSALNLATFLSDYEAVKKAEHWEVVETA